MPSNWKIRLHPTKCDKTRPTGLDYILPLVQTLAQKEKKLTTKAMITYKRLMTIGQKLKNDKDLAFKQAKSKMFQGHVSEEHFVVAMEKNYKSMIPYVLQLLTKKTTNFETKLDVRNLWYYGAVATCVMNSIQTSIKFSNFPRESLGTAVFGTNRIVELTMTRWPCLDAVQRATAQ